MKLRAVIVNVGFVLLGGCTFHASCGGSGGLNMDKAKPFVADLIESYTTVKPTTVTCPDHVDDKKDTKFACTFEVGGVSGQVAIQVTSDDGDVHVTGMTGIIASAKVEADIADWLKDKPAGASAMANCGARVHPSHPGDKLTCDIHDASGAVVAHADVVIKDADNKIEFDVVSGDAAAPAPATPPADPAPAVVPAPAP